MTVPSGMRIYHGRLAQFKPWNNSPEDWEDYWSRQSVENVLKNSKRGDLGEYECIVSHLPKDLPILEAGCGLGQIVAALSVRGFSVEGVEFSEKTVQRVLAVVPELNIRVGNIYQLDAADGAFGGYLSLGVLEHNPDGPLDGLREARRVLHPDGIACISVPYLNSARQRWMRRLPPTDSFDQSNHQFYQYYYSKEEFTDLLKQADFKTVEIVPIGLYYGLTEDFVLGRWLRERNFFHWRLHRAFIQMCQNAQDKIRQLFSHMMMYICTPI